MQLGHTIDAGSIPMAHTAFLWTENAAKIQHKYSKYTGIDVLVKYIRVQYPDAIGLWVPAQVSASSLDRGSKLRVQSPIAFA